MFARTYKRVLCWLVVAALVSACEPKPWDFDLNCDVSGNHNTAHHDVLQPPGSFETPSSETPGGPMQ